LQIDYLLLDFGARHAGLEAARFNLLSRNFNFNQALQSVVLSVMTSYYNLDGAKAALANAEAALTLADATLQSVEIKQQVGLATSTDAAQARQGVEQNKFNLENARGVLSTTQIQLATSLGLPANVNLQVAPPSNPPSLAILEEEVDKLIDLAFRQRPDLAGKYNTWRSRLASADQAEANRWPTLTSGINLQRTYYQANSAGPAGDFKGSGHFDDASAILTFRFDLFDGGNKSNLALSAKKLAESAKADLQVSELGAIADVVTNFVAFKTAAKKVDAAQALLDASRKNIDSVQIGYRNGLKSLLDLLTAQSNLTSAQSTLSQSRTDLFVSSANLSNSTGSLLPVSGLKTALATVAPLAAKAQTRLEAPSAPPIATSIVTSDDATDP
jgi:outer membrane protein TolC